MVQPKRHYPDLMEFFINLDLLVENPEGNCKKVPPLEASQLRGGTGGG